MKRIAIAVLIALGAPAHARDVAYAIVIGNNAPPAGDSSLRPLRYADDDALRYYQLFARFAETRLLAVLDGPTQKRHVGAAAYALPPTAENLHDIVATFAVRMHDDRRRGDRPVLYFVFSGHGSRAQGEPMLALLDGALTQRALYENILARMPAQLVHVIVDACHAGGVVGVRGGGFFGEEVDAKTAPAQPEDVKHVLDAMPLARYPHIGVLVATTLGEEAHEWSEIESGVFTHELVSGMLGAADVNGDRAVEYSEVQAFVAAANRDIKDPRAIPQVIARAPAANRNAPLVTLSNLAGVRFLRGDASRLGHFHIELENGQRYLDAHLAGNVTIAIPDNTVAFLRTHDREARLPSRGQIAFADVQLAPRATAARGSIDVAYREALWASNYGRSYYQGFVDSTGTIGVQFAVDDAPALERAARRTRDKKLAIGSATLAVAAGATSVFTGVLTYRAKQDFEATDVQREARDAQARYDRYLPIAIGTGAVAIAAGAAAYWLWPSSNARVVPSVSADGAGVSVELPW